MFRLKLKQLIFFSSPFWIVSGRYRRVSPLSHCGRFSREFLRPPRRSSPASAPIARIAVSPCRNVRNADHTDNMELTASLTRRLAAPWRNRPAITTSLLNRIHFVLLWFTLYRHTHTHTHAHSRVHPDVRNVALSSKIPSPPRQLIEAALVPPPATRGRSQRRNWILQTLMEQIAKKLK